MVLLEVRLYYFRYTRYLPQLLLQLGSYWDSLASFSGGAGAIAMFGKKQDLTETSTT